MLPAVAGPAMRQDCDIKRESSCHWPSCHECPSPGIWQGSIHCSPCRLVDTEGDTTPLLRLSVQTAYPSSPNPFCPREFFRLAIDVIIRIALLIFLFVNTIAPFSNCLCFVVGMSVFHHGLASANKEPPKLLASWNA